MIEIDDAGGGCFIGPEILVIHHLETGLVRYLYVLPEIQERVAYATSILKAAFAELAIPKTETIRLCRGEIFDPFEFYLGEAGFQVVREKVSTATDSLAEAKFMEVLYSYGLPRNLSLEGRNYHKFYELVGCWYFSQNKKPVKSMCKRRLKPPTWPRMVARRYPNLLRLLLEEEVAG